LDEQQASYNRRFFYTKYNEIPNLPIIKESHLQIYVSIFVLGVVLASSISSSVSAILSIVSDKDFAISGAFGVDSAGMFSLSRPDRNSSLFLL
jgi:hypothetical protein